MDRSKIMLEGAKYLGIFLILISLTILVPIIGVLTILLFPIPFVVFTTKQGWKAGLFLGLVSFFLMFIISPLALPVTISFIMGGVVIGELYRRKKAAFGVLLGGSLAFIFALLLNFVGSNLLLHENPVEVVQNMLYESMEASEQMLTAIGQQDAEAFELAYTFIEQLTYLAPTIMIIIGVSYAFLVQLISSLILRISKEEVKPFPPFREWGFPKAFIWYYLFTYIFILIGIEEGSSLYIVISNLTPILEIVMIIQGFAFMFFFFYKKKKHKSFPIVLMLVCLLFPISLNFVRIIGIIDIGFDLRKRMNS